MSDDQGGKPSWHKEHQSWMSGYERNVARPALEEASRLLPWCSFRVANMNAGHLSTCAFSVPGFEIDPIVHVHGIILRLNDPVDKTTALRRFVFDQAVEACKTPPTPQTLASLLGGPLDEEARMLARKMARSLSDEHNEELVAAQERLDNAKRRHEEACERAEAKRRLAWAYLEIQEVRGTAPASQQDKG